ncbi:MAG: hypothetical protein K8E24_013705 [Methanobacterium paludis]|nr:hypothetical protein [Methanobacterium paludis]
MVVAESRLKQRYVDELMIHSIYYFSKKYGMSLRTIAKECYVDPSYFPKVKAGIIHYSDDLDERLSNIHWFLYLVVLEKSSGGLMMNPLRFDPNMDITPSALKERLSKNMEEAEQALRKLRAYQRNPNRDEVIETIYQSLDVQIDTNVMIGTLSEKIGMSRDELIRGYRKHREDEEGKR